MSWIDRILALRNFRSKAPPFLVGHVYQTRYGEPPPPYTQRRPVEYSTSESVFAATTAYANRISSTPLSVYQRTNDGDEAIANNEITALLSNPNPFVTRYQLFWHLVADQLLSGNAYWFLAGVPGGKPQEIWRLNPRFVRIVLSEDDYIGGYIYTIDGQDVPLDPGEVLHFPRPNPADTHDFYGQSVLQVAARAAQTARDMTAWNQGMFSNNAAVPAGMVVVKEPVSDEQFDAIKQQWRSSYGGNTRKTAFLRADQLEFQSLGLSQTDLDFIRGLQFTDEQVYRVFGTYHLLSAQYADDRKVNERLFLEEHAWPMCISVSERISDQLCSFYGPATGSGSYYVKFDDIRPRERSIDLDEQRERAKGLTLNEWRSERGLSPLDGGDDVLYVHVQSGEKVEFERAAMPDPVAVPQIEAPAIEDGNESEQGAPVAEDMQERAESDESRGNDIGDGIGENHNKFEPLYDFGFDITLASSPALQPYVRRLQRTFNAVDGVEVSWVEPDDWHMSLVYADEPMPLDAVRAMFSFINLTDLSAALGKAERIALWPISSIEYALVAELRADLNVHNLHDRMYEIMQSQGIVMNEYTQPASWTPHITLAYIMVDPGGADLTTLIPEISFDVPLEIIRLVINKSEARRWSLFPLPPTESEMHAELKAWRKYITKRWGEDARPFVTRALGSDISNAVKASLDQASDLDMVDAVFNTAHQIVDNDVSGVLSARHPDRASAELEIVLSHKSTRAFTAGFAHVPPDTVAYMRALKIDDALPNVFDAAGEYVTAHHERHHTGTQYKAFDNTSALYRGTLYNIVSEALTFNDDGSPSIDKRAFRRQGRRSIETFFEAAFFDGLVAAGVRAETLDEDERRDLSLEIKNEQSFWNSFSNEVYDQIVPSYANVDRLQRDVLAARNAGDVDRERELSAAYIDAYNSFLTKQQQTLSRVETWVNKGLSRIYEQGKLSAQRNQMMEWVLGATEQHCETCLGAAGQRHRAKEWKRTGIVPKADTLACGGWQCDCQLKPTKERAKGRLSRIPHN